MGASCNYHCWGGEGATPLALFFVPALYVLLKRRVGGGWMRPADNHSRNDHQAERTANSER